MNTKSINVAKAGLLALALLAISVAPLRAQNSIWTSSFSGKWEIGTNWSGGHPQAGQYVIITNSPTKTVTIDATTSSNASGTMTIHALFLSGGSSTSSNLLALTNAGTAIPLQISNALQLGQGNIGPGYVDIANSAFQAGFTSQIHWGGITLENGLLLMTNGLLEVGFNTNRGDLTVNGGTAQFNDIHLALGGAPCHGTWTINGGISTCSNLFVGVQGNGSLKVNGGTLFATNFQTQLILGQNTGAFGNATITNGEVDTYDTYVGNLGAGVVNLSGGLLTAANSFIIGVSNANSGSVFITGGTLAVTNAAHNAFLDVRNGSLTLNGGLLQVDNLILTNGGIFTNISGTLQYTGPFQVANGGTVTVAGGTVIAVTNFTVGSSAGATSSVSVAGGTLIVTNAPLLVGPVGVGLMTVSAGSTVTAQTLILGSAVPGASGTLTMNDNSTLRITSLLSVNSVNSFDLPGINVVVDGSGSTLNIGDDSPGKMTISSPSASQTWHNIKIGYNATGTLLQSAGKTVVDNTLIVGNCVVGANVPGLVTLSGGTLYVTNSTHSAILDVRNGTFMLNSGGTLVVDNLIVTNSCGSFIKNGGTLVVNPANITLDPNMDATGGGMPNGWKLAHGLDPLSASGNEGPNGDPDHDGQSNLNEYLAGTDPQNPASNFRVLGVTLSGPDVLVSWTAVGGHSYMVQASNSKVANANFADVNPSQISFAGPGEGTATYRHVGGAAHSVGYYRVRLGP